MIMLDYYKTNDMLLPNADFEDLDEDMQIRSSRQSQYPDRFTYYGEPDVFPRFAIYDDERGAMGYYE